MYSPLSGSSTPDRARPCTRRPRRDRPSSPTSRRRRTARLRVRSPRRSRPDRPTPRARGLQERHRAPCACVWKNRSCLPMYFFTSSSFWSALRPPMTRYPVEVWNHRKRSYQSSGLRIGIEERESQSVSYSSPSSSSPRHRLRPRRSRRQPPPSPPHSAFRSLTASNSARVDLIASIAPSFSLRCAWLLDRDGRR